MTPDRELQEQLATEAVERGTSVRELEDRVRAEVRTIEAPEDEGPDLANPPATRTGRPTGVVELELLLSDHLSTRVKVDMGARHGRIVVDFATLDDLERIYRAMIGDSSITA